MGHGVGRALADRGGACTAWPPESGLRSAAEYFRAVNDEVAVLLHERERGSLGGYLAVAEVVGDGGFCVSGWRSAWVADGDAIDVVPERLIGVTIVRGPGLVLLTQP